MSVDVQNLLVRKIIHIHAPAAHVFDVFVHRMDLWWPRSHHIGQSSGFSARLEPMEGGRWYERGDDGSECDWGRVLAYEPPQRLLLSWDISAQWTYDPSVANEVEVRFIPEGETQTKVELEHRKIERYGSAAEAMFGVFDSENGWSGILKKLAEAAEQPQA